MVVCLSQLLKALELNPIEEARKEYKKLLEEGWEKLVNSTVIKKMVNRYLT